MRGLYQNGCEGCDPKNLTARSTISTRQVQFLFEIVPRSIGSIAQIHIYRFHNIQLFVCNKILPLENAGITTDGFSESSASDDRT